MHFLEQSNILLAMGLTLFAGMSTGFGGLIVLLVNKTNTRLLSVSLGFSAGVMIYVSFVELFFEAREMLILKLGHNQGSLVVVGAFFSGILLTALIDKLVPSYENPHESRSVERMQDVNKLDGNTKLLRTGIFTALIIIMHNFPEGMATFVSTIQSPTLGVAIAIAVAIHNIPEGISVAIPVYYATGSRKKAFAWSFISGIGEPLGALLAYFILLPFLNEIVFGVLFATIAGIMIYISFDELLPSAHEYGEHHLTIFGLISGMFVMALSLLIIT